MKLKAIYFHLSIPVILGISLIGFMADYETINPEDWATGLFRTLFYLSAPYLLWLAFVGIFNPTNMVAHSGFVSSTIALVLTAVASLSPSDASGLPYEVFYYWPLALLLLIVIPGITTVYERKRKQLSAADTS